MHAEAGVLAGCSVASRGFSERLEMISNQISYPPMMMTWLTVDGVHDQVSM
jgi:hypothetical protein